MHNQFPITFSSGRSLIRQAADSRDDKSTQIPRQAIFLATGALAGSTSILSAALVFPSLRFSGLGSLLSPTLGAGVRFWAFDLSRSGYQALNVPDVALRGGLAGASGGVIESLALYVSQRVRRGPSAVTSGDLVRATSKHATLLGLCFGSFTFLSSRLYPERSPSPQPMPFILGAAAGAFGNSVMALFSRAPSAELMRTVMVGSVRVGITIGVQVTSAAWALECLA